MISKTSSTSISGVTLMNGVAGLLSCFSLFISSPCKNAMERTKMGLIRPIAYKSHSYAPWKFYSLYLKASGGGQRAEINDCDRSDVLIWFIEYPALRHGGRKFLLNRRIVRRHDVGNLRGPSVLANLRSQNDVLFP